MINPLFLPALSWSGIGTLAAATPPCLSPAGRKSDPAAGEFD